MKKYVTVVKENAGEVPIIFLFNKADLPEQAQVKVEEVQKVESLKHIPCFKTSAKTGEQVAESFTKMGEMLVEKWLNKY